MAGWIYAVELWPAGYVKVGRTTRLGRRLQQHLSAAGFGGAEIVRVHAVACDDVAAAERSALVSLARLPGAAVVHGTETFAGVSFDAACARLDELHHLGREIGEVAWSQTENATLVSDCRAVLAGCGSAALHLDELAAELRTGRPGRYDGLTVPRLGALLRQIGVPVVQVKRHGRNTSGVRRAAL